MLETVTLHSISHMARARSARIPVLTAIFLGLALTMVPIVRADTRVGALTMSPGENILVAGLIDPAAGFAYFATETSPGRVVKVRLSDLTRIGALPFSSGENLPSTGEIDTAAGFAYFGTDTSPGRIVKIRLSDFTKVGAITLNPGEDHLGSSVIDFAGGFAYFGTDTSPGIVVKVRLSDFTRVGALTMITGENLLSSAVLDSAGGFAYFGTDTNRGIVVKVRLSDFTRVGALTLPNGEGHLGAAVIDDANRHAYFGTDLTSPAIVVKVRLSNFTRVEGLTLNSGEDDIGSAVIDTANRFSYWGTATIPGIVVKVALPQALAVTVNCPDSGLTAGKPFNCIVTATGGTSPYTGTGTFSRTQPVKGTFTQSFTVTDANAVSANGSDSVTIGAQPFVVTVDCPNTGLTAGKPFTCNVSASGGTAPYLGTGSRQATFPVKGSYPATFTVTDANGNTASSSDTVVIAAQPLVATVDCPNSGLTAGKPFTCTVSASGGTGPYLGTGTFSLTRPVKGTYPISFTVTDANGNSASSSDTVVIVQQPLIAMVDCPSSATAGKPVSCTVSASGGTAPYLGAGTFPVTFPVKGTITTSFTVTDANGNSASGSDTVVVAPQPLIIASIVVSPSPWSVPIPGEPVTFTASASGGTAPYLFRWDLSGDGIEDAQGGSVQWTYAGPQTLSVRVNATDLNNAHSSDFFRTVTVLSLDDVFRFDWADRENNGVSDIVDIAFAAICFNQTSNSTNWANCNYWDIDLDSKITIIDIAFVAISFGTSTASPFPGQGQVAEVIDPGWVSKCSSLGPLYQAYCLTRFG